MIVVLEKGCRRLPEGGKPLGTVPRVDSNASSNLAKRDDQKHKAI
jgi:hypothetical protein